MSFVISVKESVQIGWDAMWNVLVDYFSENEPLTVSAVVITLVWSTLVLYFILKLIVEKVNIILSCFLYALRLHSSGSRLGPISVFAYFYTSKVYMNVLILFVLAVSAWLVVLPQVVNV